MTDESRRSACLPRQPGMLALPHLGGLTLSHWLLPFLESEIVYYIPKPVMPTTPISILQDLGSELSQDAGLVGILFRSKKVEEHR